MYDQELLFDTLCVQSKSNDDKLMMEFIERKIEEAKERGYPIENHTDAYGNIYVTKGTGFLSEAGHVSFPSIVCHTDTVHNVVKNFFVVE